MLHPPRHYLYLDAVARTGSIRKAAQSLNVAATALNRKIVEIESEIGTPLFERLPRGVRLTAAGEVLITAIRRSLAELESAESQIEQLQGLVRGTVRIACSESVANDLLPSTITAYQTAHPGVQFKVTVGATGALLAALSQDEVELVVAHDPPPSDTLHEIVSLEQPLCAVMRPDHPLASRTSMRLTDCQRHPIALCTDAFGSRRLIDQLAGKMHLSMQVIFEANSMETLKNFVRTSQAICFQSQIGTLKETRHDNLVAIPLIDRELQGRLVMGARAGRTLPVAATGFIQDLKIALEDA